MQAVLEQKILNPLALLRSGEFPSLSNVHKQQFREAKESFQGGVAGASMVSKFLLRPSPLLSEFPNPPTKLLSDCNRILHPPYDQGMLCSRPRPYVGRSIVGRTRMQPPSTLTAQELGRFYEAALAAGAILSGFTGVFLSFRIEREAKFYPDKSHFPVSLLLLGISGVAQTVFGVFLPLCAMIHQGAFSTRPALILAGIMFSTLVAVAYFMSEMFHYHMFRINRENWNREWALAAFGLLLAISFSVLTYRLTKIAVVVRDNSGAREEIYMITSHTSIAESGSAAKDEKYTMTYGPEILEVMYSESQISTAQPGDFPGTGLHFHAAYPNPDLSQIPSVGMPIRACILDQNHRDHDGDLIIPTQPTPEPCMARIGGRLHYAVAPNSTYLFSYVDFGIVSERTPRTTQESYGP